MILEVLTEFPVKLEYLIQIQDFLSQFYFILHLFSRVFMYHNLCTDLCCAVQTQHSTDTG